MSKKTFYIILSILFGLIIIGGLIWYFILKPKEAPAPVSGVDFTVPGQIKSGTNLTVISEGPIISLRQSNGGIIFYDFSGRSWQLNFGDLNPILLNEKPIENLTEIVWPKAISADGKKIAYQKNNSLFTSDPDGKNQRTLVKELGLRDITVKWPAIGTIALTSKPSGLVGGSLWFFDIKSLSMSKIIDNLFGLEALFSFNGHSFIYSYTNQNGQDLKLAFYDEKGNSSVLNNVSTLVDKCAFAKDQINIYCAVPKSWSDFAVLPDDYYKNTSSTNDDFWKINVVTGEKTLILQEVGNVSNLVVSEDESSVFFISKENQLLYKLDIK